MDGMWRKRLVAVLELCRVLRIWHLLFEWSSISVFVRGKLAASELLHGWTPGLLGSGSCWQCLLRVTTSALDAMAFADRCCQVDPRVVSAWATLVYKRLPTDLLEKENFVLGPLEQVREGAFDILKVVPYYASGGRKAACAVADCLTSIRHHALARHYQQLPVKWIQSGVPRVPLDAGQVDLISARGADTTLFQLREAKQAFLAQIKLLYDMDGQPEVDLIMGLYINVIEDAMFVAKSILHKPCKVQPWLANQGLEGMD